MQLDDITISEEDWEKIRISLPISLNNEDITMVILSILLQYIENPEESFNILKECIENLPNAYEYNGNIKSRMH